MAEPAISPEMSTVERDKALLPQGMTDPMISVEKGEPEIPADIRGEPVTGTPSFRPAQELETLRREAQTPLIKTEIDVPSLARRDIEIQRGRLTDSELVIQFNNIVNSTD